MAKDKSGNPNKKGGAKKGAKKWGGVHVKDKINNTHTVDQKLYDRIMKDIAKMSLISIATVSDKFKVGGSVVRQAMREALSKNLIVPIGEAHAAIRLYKGAEWTLKKAEEEVETGKKGKKKGN